MGSFSYYWAERLSTVKPDKFYLHRRCCLNQMEYQNIWLLCIFYSDQHRHVGMAGKRKKRYMADMSDTDNQAKESSCTCVHA